MWVKWSGVEGIKGVLSADNNSYTYQNYNSLFQKCIYDFLLVQLCSKMEGGGSLFVFSKYFYSSRQSYISSSRGKTLTQQLYTQGESP